MQKSLKNILNSYAHIISESFINGNREQASEQFEQALEYNKEIDVIMLYNAIKDSMNDSIKFDSFVLFLLMRAY